jgi:hypothetical protein
MMPLVKIFLAAPVIGTALTDLFEHLDRGGRCDGDLGSVVEFDPAADADALAGKVGHLEFRLPESPHVFGLDRHREIGAVVGAEIDEGPVLWRNRHWNPSGELVAAHHVRRITPIQSQEIIRYVPVGSRDGEESGAGFLTASSASVSAPITGMGSDAWGAHGGATIVLLAAAVAIVVSGFGPVTMTRGS